MNYGSTKKARLDNVVFDKGLAESREKARALILEGSILVNGIVVDKAGAQVRPDDLISAQSKMPFVSRGGQKLAHALTTFSISVAGKTTMDVGASTGGFTDCLIQNGASKIYAVDVGYGQFSWKLRNDPRVVLMEKTNIRYLDHEKVPEQVDMAVIDVSFISLLKVIPKVLDFLKIPGEIIALIKPQFEAGRKDVGKGGVVRDENTRIEVVERIKVESVKMGLQIAGTTPSPIRGPKGNVEYLIYLKLSETTTGSSCL